MRIDPVANPVSGREIADQMTEDTERVNLENCTQVLEAEKKKASKRDEREIKSKSSRSRHGCLLLLQESRF